MLDTGASEEAFLDQEFAQAHSIPLTPLAQPRELLGFDGLPASTGPVTHTAEQYFNIPGHPKPILTTFHVTKLPGWDLIIGLPWMQRNEVNLHLRPEGNSISFGGSKPTGTEGPQIPLSNPKLPAPSELHYQHQEARRKARLQKNPITIALAAAKLEEPVAPKKPISIHLIGAAPFATLSKAPGIELFAATMRDIEKALQPKTRTDPAAALPPEYHDYLDVFSQAEADKLPPHRDADHKIDLEPGKVPPYGPLYGMSQDELKVLKKFLDENLEKGFIRPSNSSAASPVLFARKPGGGLRLCVDYRALNAITVKNRYPIPLIQETLARICRAKIYTKLDIIAAFNKIRMAAGEEWKTAFRTRYGLYESLVMNFGLCGAPSTFQKYINDLLHDYLDDFCTAYIDDILIYSDNEKEHKKHVRLVLARLREAGLQVDIDKCAFGVSEVRYLGLIITTQGVQMDQEKLKAVTEWKTPACVKDVQAFLGFANFYRRFIQGFSLLAKPLTQLTKKDTKFEWSDKCEGAFQSLKLAFTTAPILIHFDPIKEVVLETDASDEVVAGVMSQYDAESRLKPVAYFSTKMSPAECNYEIYDKELLAIIRAFELWRPELEGTEIPVTVVSDHKNLEYFMTTKLLSRRQARWSEFLSRFNFKITYRPGTMNRRADALTRQSNKKADPAKEDRRAYQWQTVLKPENLDIKRDSKEEKPSGIKKAILRPVTVEEAPEDPSESDTAVTDEENPSEPEEVDLDDAIWSAYAESEWAQSILTALNSGARTMKGFPLAESEVRDNRVYFRDRLFIPDNDELRLRLIQQAHDTPIAGHPGRAKTQEIMTRNYYWPGMTHSIKQFVRNCRPCHRAKASREKYHGSLKPLPIPERRWAHISIDFVVGLPLSNDYYGRKCINIMVVTDRLTKMVKYIPMDGISAEDTAKAFYLYIWKDYGFPISITSDRGTQFENHFWNELCQRVGVKANLSTAFHPETDGQTENANAVMEQYLRTFVSFLQDDWARWLPSAEFAANNHFSESTLCTPFFANSAQHPRMGIEPRSHWEDPTNGRELRDRLKADALAEKMEHINEILMEQMTLAQANQEEFANRHRQPAPKYREKDLVWLNAKNLQTQRPSKKLSNKFEGPFEISEIISSHAYRLKLPDDWSCHDVFHTNLLRPAASDPIPGQTPPEPFPTRDARGHEVWDVDIIESSRMRRGALEFRVKWKNTDTVTWEPFNYVAGANEALDSYFDLHSHAPGHETWNAFKAEPWDLSDTDSDPGDPLFVPQEAGEG